MKISIFRLDVVLSFIAAVFGVMAGSSCNFLKEPGKQTSDTIAIRRTIDTLYRSFGFNAGSEPDWEVMGSLALPGATFISAPAPGEKREGVPVEKFIASYKSFLQHSPAGKSGYQEEVLQVSINRVNTVATATVLFKGSVPGEGRQRKPGMDNIQLLLDKGRWKITAFTTQSESDPIGIN